MAKLEYDDLIAIIKEIPSCIFFKDTDCKYVFATHYWSHLNQEGENWTIEGKSDLDIRKNKENAMKALEADRHILATGEMQDYVIEEEGADGSVEYLQLLKKPVRNKNGEIIGIVGLINNVTKEKLLEKKLDRYISELKTISELDPLTGLRNRRSGIIQMNNLSKTSISGVYCLMDIDDFKHINDNYGHDIGDMVLVKFASVLKECFREDDVVVRLGGDEFCVFLANIHDLNVADKIIQRFIGRMESIFFTEIGDRSVKVSYGMVLTTTEMSLKDMYKSADTLMYEHKRMRKLKSGSSR